MKSIFEEVALNHGFEIDTMGVVLDHMHVFLSFPPRYSISKVTGILKSVSMSVIFYELPEMKKLLCGGEF